MAKSQGFNEVSNKTNVILNIIFIILALSCILPFVLVLSISFTDQEVIYKHGYQFIPKIFSLEAYRFLFNGNQSIIRAYGVTIFTSVVGTVINILAAAMYAYPLSRNDFPFRKLFSTLVLVTLLFSGGLVPTYLVNVNILHLKNTIWALILPGIKAAFNIFIMRTYYKQNIPVSIIESAKIDGAGEIRTFFQLVLPLAVPVIAAFSLFNLFRFWNNWQNSLYYITDTKLYSLQYVMQQAIMNLQYLQEELAANANLDELIESVSVPQESVRMAMVLVGIGPIVIAYPFFQKYFVQGLTVGAVKG